MEGMLPEAIPVPGRLAPLNRAWKEQQTSGIPTLRSELNESPI